MAAKFTFYAWLLTALAAIACNGTTKSPAGADSTAADTASSKPVLSIVSGCLPPMEDEYHLDSVTTIHFPELTVSFEGYIANSPDLRSPEDTVMLTTTELGILPLGNYASVQSDQLTDLQMAFRFTTVSCVYSGEGGLLCMYGWKSFVSRWETLPEKDGRLYIRDLEEGESQQFPAVDLSEWKERVRKHLGESFYESVKNAGGVNELPGLVDLDQIQFSVTGKRKTDGATVTKVIIFSVPLG